jgi:hypothetical protein
MQVNPGALDHNHQAESIGCVGSTVRWMLKKIASLVQPIFTWMGWSIPSFEENPANDVSFEIALLDGLRKGYVTEPAVLRHFEKYVSSPEREKIYEDLGRNRSLSYQDRILNTVWRNSQAVSVSYQRKGVCEAKIDPYLVASHLEKALQKKIDTTRECT